MLWPYFVFRFPGLAVYLHCDSIAAWVASQSPGARVRCIADAGFFPDVQSVYGGFNARAQFMNGFEMINATGGVDASCIAAQPSAADHWKCYFAQ